MDTLINQIELYQDLLITQIIAAESDLATASDDIKHYHRSRYHDLQVALQHPEQCLEFLEDAATAHSLAIT